MAKGNRKERRAAETARALGSGDVGALSRLAERGAEYARGPIVRALGSVTAEAADSGALLALAADVAGRLRRQGQIGAAIEVAAAGADRSPLLRLERALCAFAIGRDDEAEAAAAADPRIARAMAPLLSATQPESERKAGRDLPSGLEAAAAAVHQAVRGKHAAARRALGGIPEAERRALLHGPIEAALALAARRASLRERDLAPLASLPRTEPFEAVRRAAAEEAVATSPALGRLACRRMGLPPDVARRLEGLAASSRPRAVDPVEAALALARDVGADAFAPEDRARASLYEGFALLDQDPARAAAAFDRSVQLGGDLIEALRGRLLVTLRASGGPVCPDCGERHGQASRVTGAPADRLARALDSVEGGAPLAVAARVLAADGWLAAGDTRAALAALAAARPHATGKAFDGIDLTESWIVALTPPDRARALLAALTERSPGNVEAWNGRIALAVQGGDRALAERLTVEAARLTSDAATVAAARAIRGKAGELAPFEGIVPGAATAGALAAELERLLRARKASGSDAPSRAALDAAIARHREALQPKARLALDAARVALAVAKGGTDAARSPEASDLVLALVREGSTDAPSLGKLVAVLIRLGAQAEIANAARVLAQEQPAAASLAVLVEAAAFLGEVDLAHKLLGIASAGLARLAVGQLRRIIGARPAPAELARLVAVVDEVDALLAPETSLADLLHEPSDEGHSDALAEVARLAADGVTAELYVRMLGLPLGGLDRLSPAQRRQADEYAARSMTDPGSAESLRQLVERAYGARTLAEATAALVARAAAARL